MDSQPSPHQIASMGGQEPGAALDGERPASAIWNRIPAIAQFFGTGYVNSAASGLPSRTSVGEIKTGTLESVFSAPGAPTLILDARKIANGGPDAVRLLGPLLMREVDESYTLAEDDAYCFATMFPADFDGLVWFSKSTPSVLRP